MSFLLGLPIFEGYVKFQGCTWTSPEIDDSGQDLSFREDFFRIPTTTFQRAAAWRARCGPEFCNLQINKGKVAVVIAEIPLAFYAKFYRVFGLRLKRREKKITRTKQQIGRDGNTKKTKKHVFHGKSGKISGNVWPILAATKRLRQSKAMSPNNSVDILPVRGQLQMYRRSTLAWWMSKHFVGTKNGGILKQK